MRSLQEDDHFWWPHAMMRSRFLKKYPPPPLPSAEHFGMAVVEAMSAGAIPVVLNQGGLREIVHTQPGAPAFGRLCNTLDDFARHTLEIFELPERKKDELRTAVRARAERYSTASFNYVFQTLVHQGRHSWFWKELKSALGTAPIRLPTNNTQNVAVIVETRADIALSLVIKSNLLMLPCDWGLHVFHGTLNGHTVRQVSRFTWHLLCA